MVGDNCILNAGCSIVQGSILGPGVVVDPDKNILDVRLQSTPSGAGMFSLAFEFYIFTE